MIRKFVAAAALAVVPMVASIVPAHAIFSEPIPVGNWTLSNTDASPAANKANVTMNVTREANGTIRLEGTTGCNTYWGTAERAGEVMIKISPLSMTRMACEGDRDAAERAFVNAFSGKVVGFSPATSATTTITSSGQDWTFARAAGTTVVPASVQGNWKLFNASKSALRGAKATLTINADGSFTANAGCNSLFGSVRSDADVLRFPGVGSSFKFCKDVMDQEFAFVEGLNGATHVQAVADRLYITGHGGQMSFIRQK